MTSLTKWQVPYDQNGNLLKWASPQPYRAYGVDWRDNVPFHDKLIYQGFTRGQSAASLIWADDDGHTYPMFLSELDSLLTDFADFVESDRDTAVATVTGDWRVFKRGQNFGIGLA